MKSRMKSNLKRSLFISVFCVFLGGCAYLGFHGPSIRLKPDVHEGVTEDSECLECHHPDNSDEGPPTSHPNFTGCLKCHNDEVRS